MMRKDMGASLRDRAVVNGAGQAVSALRASVPSAVVDVIAEANNSLYGSQGFFLSTNGGEPDKYHLARPIERLKADANRSWRKAEIYETTLRAIVDFGFLNATSIDAARLAGEALATAQAIETRRAETERLGAKHESAVRQDAPQGGSDAS